MKMFWTFKLSFDEEILAFLDLAIAWATFPQIWATFCPIFGHPGEEREVWGFERVIKNCCSNFFDRKITKIIFFRGRNS